LEVTESKKAAPAFEGGGLEEEVPL